MLPKLLKTLGFRDVDEAVEFLMCGLATLPALLMLGGFMLSGAFALIVLIVLLAAVGMQAPPPEPSAKKDTDGAKTRH